MLNKNEWNTIDYALERAMSIIKLQRKMEHLNLIKSINDDNSANVDTTRL